MEASKNSLSSEDFLNTIMGEWVVLNLDDDDCSKSETTVTSEEENSSGKQSTNYDSDEITRHHYECGACGETVLDYCLPKHHYTQHPDVTFNMQMYVPIEIEKQIQCTLCNEEILASDFEGHQNFCQVENWLSLVNNEFVSSGSSETTSDYKSLSSGYLTPLATFSRIFQCEACGALIFEENLDAHHKSIHSDIPMYVNLFELYQVTKQEECDVCLQWVENLEKHSVNCFTIKEREFSSEAAEGFRNVCMSEEEFQRLSHRIDEVDGRFYLRDSE